jgi:nuclear GTP-binding protein
MQEKLKKAKMAMARGFLQRKQAVDRNIARREKLESQVDLTKIVREIEKEEKKEKVKEEKMTRFDDTEEKQNQEHEAGVGEAPAAKKMKLGTAKERRAAERAEKEKKGTNYYSDANVKNKNRNKSSDIKSKLNAGRNKKTQQRKHQQ